ncbi:MAG: prepilin-type N-terminal cleavage/methylation domain-containing protein [Sedimentisphaerales bacterium]|nr:prepilin-type N-terminal cleavage/methylation domain-containing protein [Sedimentisphaerales bacterium]
MERTRSTHKPAFTLIELLVVIGIIGILLSVLMPALAKARNQAISVVCRSNVKQLLLANLSYAQENDDNLVLAAQAYDTSNNHRWHGVRNTKNDPFEPARSPLVHYLDSGEVKLCPQQVEYRRRDPGDFNYEDGCGGYGYNMTYLGSRIWQKGSNDYNKPTRLNEVSQPCETLMFADTAMAIQEDGALYLIEYSFAEPPFFLANGEIQKAWGYASPSIHFRHDKKANIGWVDGHVDERAMAPFEEDNIYGVKSADFLLGWFKPVDNSLFDLR